MDNANPTLLYFWLSEPSIAPPAPSGNRCDCRTAAVIDLKKHKELWEDIEDVLVSQSRRKEKRIPFEKVKADLIKSGKLRG